MLEYILSLRTSPLLLEGSDAVLGAFYALSVQLEHTRIRRLVEGLDYAWYGEAKVVDLRNFSYDMRECRIISYLSLKLFQ